MSLNPTEITPAVNATLDRLDPERTTIVVGTAAIHPYVETVGATPISVADVDVLCSEDFFNTTLENATKQIQAFEGPVSCRLRRPYGRLLNAGATNLALEIYFDYSEKLLPFTACTSMSTAGYPIDYESRNNATDTQIMAGYRCLRLGEGLLLAATVGRDKDLALVDKILAERDLFVDFLSEEQAAEIEERAEESRRLAHDHPGVPYPRTI